MTISTMLAQNECRADAVYCFCPRGFANESNVRPIPTIYSTAADNLAELAARDVNDKSQLVKVEDLTQGQRYSILQWLNNSETVECNLIDWAMLCEDVTL